MNVSPRQGDVFYLRLLLHHVPGAASFAELRTVGGVVCETNKEACRLRGLLQEDGEWDLALREATETQMMMMMIWALGRSNTNGYIAPITSRPVIHLIRVDNPSILEPTSHTKF